MRRIYKLTKRPSKGSQFKHYQLTVPTDVAELFEERGITGFVPQLTEDGLLYRPYRLPVESDKWIPNWLKEDQYSAFNKDNRRTE